jgi:uncharacterized membrane protein
MSSYQEYEQRNSYGIGYTQQSPNNHTYEQLNTQQQQAYQEQLYPDHEGPHYQQQHVPPVDSPHYDTAPGAGLSSLPGISGSFAAGLSYLGLWLTGLLFLLFERKNRLIRFHAMQSLLLFGGVNVLWFFLIRIMIDHTPFIWGFAIFAFVIINVIAAVSWFVGMIAAFSGKYTKLPLVGDIAERYVNSTMPANPRQF